MIQGPTSSEGHLANAGGSGALGVLMYALHCHSFCIAPLHSLPPSIIVPCSEVESKNKCISGWGCLHSPWGCAGTRLPQDDSGTLWYSCCLLRCRLRQGQGWHANGAQLCHHCSQVKGCVKGNLRVI